MDISKGDLVKSKGVWAIVNRADSGLETISCFLLTTGNPSRVWVYEEIDQVVYAEPTEKFLDVLSQQEKLEYARYFMYKAQEHLSNAESATGDYLNKLAKTYGITSTTKPFKYRVEDGVIHPVEVDITFTDDSGKYLENILTRWDTSGNWLKDKGLFDPFDDQTPYPLDFDNFVYGDVEQCYDEERDYLVIKCVDDFIEHMMTTR